MGKKRIEEKVVDDTALYRETLMGVFNEDLPDQFKIPFGIDILDVITGGWFLTGTYTMFAAPPGSGKSTLTIQNMRNFFELYPNGFGVYGDSEQASTDDRLINLGIEVANPRFFKVSYGFTIEKLFALIRGIIEVKIKTHKEDVPTLVVWDSVDASSSEKETEVDSPEKATGQRAKVLNFMFRKHLPLMRKYNIALISINHIGQKLSMNAYEEYDGRLAALGNYVIGGGKAMMYFPYTMIWLRARITKKNDERLADWGIPSGFIVEATTLKCKSFSFRLTVPMVFDTVNGFDNLRTKALNMYEDDWFDGSTKYSLKTYPEMKFYIKDVINLYHEDSTFAEKFEETWKDYIDFKYGKYKKIKEMVDSTGGDMLEALSTLDPETKANIMKEVIHEEEEDSDKDEAKGTMKEDGTVVFEDDGTGL